MAIVRQELSFHVFWDYSFICVLLNQSGLLLARRLLELQKQPFCLFFGGSNEIGDIKTA